MVTATASQSERIWTTNFAGVESFDDDLGLLGAWVGPRAGFNRRNQEERENYVLRRLLVAWRIAGCLRFPFDLMRLKQGQGRPDYSILWPDGERVGIEFTDACEEATEATRTLLDEVRAEGRDASALPRRPDTVATAEMVSRAIYKKVTAFENGNYRETPTCDLAVYDNTPAGGFLDARDLVAVVGRPAHLVGRFRQVHLVKDGVVVIDIFGECRSVGISNCYEIDYAAWIFDQIEQLRRGAAVNLDLLHIAEELRDLGNERVRALGSQLQVLMLHLLKWQFQPERRTRSWRFSIANAREEIDDILDESPSLVGRVHGLVLKRYPRARRNAAEETGFDESALPALCPYDEAQLLASDFMPE